MCAKTSLQSRSRMQLRAQPATPLAMPFKGRKTMPPPKCFPVVPWHPMHAMPWAPWQVWQILQVRDPRML